jgi:basic amino acid/polyamine antiporter, APA family
LQPESPDKPVHAASLVRAMGSWGVAASIVNITIAGSIFVLPGTLGASMGAAAPLAYLLGAALFVPVVLSLAAVGSRIVTSGGPYIYVETAFGRFPGFLIAALLWVSAVSGSGGLAAALADQCAHAIPAMAAPLPHTLLLLAVYGSLVLVNALGVRAGARANALLATAKTLPLLIIAALGFRYGHAQNFAITQWPDSRALGTALILLVFAYSGVETALAPSGEMRDNDKVVPTGVFMGVGFVVALYIVIQAVCQSVLGHDLAGHPAPLTAVAEKIFPGGGAVVVITAAIALLGCLQGDLLATSRLLYAMARDGLLPRPLARVTSRSRVPIVAIVTHAGAACAVAIGGSFNTLALVSGGAFCFVYIGCAAAAWQLQRLGLSQTPAPMMLPGGALIPAAGIIGFMSILATLHREEWIAIGAAVAGICGLYGIARRQRIGTS